MIDYDKTREEATTRKVELLARQLKIKEETGRLNEEAEQNRRELIGLDQILDGLDFVSSDEHMDSEPIGFTDSIRKLLTETPIPLAPTQIRDSLQARGIVGSTPKNLLINVHKVLERIEPELVSSTTTDGKTGYKHRAALVRSGTQAPADDLLSALKASLARDRKIYATERKKKLGNIVKGAAAIQATAENQQERAQKMEAAFAVIEEKFGKPPIRKLDYEESKKRWP